MPLDLSCDTDEVIDLATYLDEMERVDFDDRDAVVATAPRLAALANHRGFLLDALADQVRERMRREAAGFVPEYTPNVFLLAPRERFAVRAILWPPATASMSPAERAVFSFELPHDHNFDFMTVGYHGPGYDTDLFEYDGARVVGYPGEPVDLVPLGRQRLHPGRIWYFRRGQDVHTQLPPPALSVSINLLVHRPGELGPQYVFDLERRTVTKNLDRDGQVLLVDMAAALGDRETMARVAALAADHPSPATRLAAFQALARHDGPAAWDAARRDASELVRRHAEIATR